MEMNKLESDASNLDTGAQACAVRAGIEEGFPVAGSNPSQVLKYVDALAYEIQSCKLEARFVAAILAPNRLIEVKAFWKLSDLFVFLFESSISIPNLQTSVLVFGANLEELDETVEQARPFAIWHARTGGGLHMIEDQGVWKFCSEFDRNSDFDGVSINNSMQYLVEDRKVTVSERVRSQISVMLDSIPHEEDDPDFGYAIWSFEREIEAGRDSLVARNKVLCGNLAGENGDTSENVDFGYRVLCSITEPLTDDEITETLLSFYEPQPELALAVKTLLNEGRLP
jgi:hypothetical protein